MANKPTASHAYWDTSVYTAYIKDEPGRADVVEGLWEEIRQSGGRIVTSRISRIEVAFWGEEHGSGVLIPENEKKLDRFWNHPTFLVVELSDWVERRARWLLRDARSSKQSLKPMDAIHLATADWVNQTTMYKIGRFHTYDSKLEKFGPLIGMTVEEPTVLQPKLV